MLDLNPILPMPVIAILAAAMLGWHLMFYRRRLPAGRPWHWLAMTCRVCLCAVLAAVALRPRLLVTAESTEKSRLCILRDVSDSMALRDMPSGRSRQEAIDRALARHQGAVAELERRFEIDTVTFARQLEPSEQPVDRNATAIGEALAALGTARQGSRIAAVLLFSDGRSNSGRSVARGAGEWMAAGIPVHAVRCGRVEMAPDTVDALLLDLLCPATVESGQALAVTVRGRWRGLAGRPTRIECRLDDELALTAYETPTEQDQALDRTLTVPQELSPGFHRLRVQLQAYPGEVSPANNELDTFIRVKPEGLQILYLETVIRPEFKFLRRLLESSEGLTPEIKSPFWLRSAPGKQYLTSLDLSRYDVVILGDLQRQDLDDAQWAGLSNLVGSRGKGLLLLGGSLSLLPALWQGNPVADCLPVNLARGTPRSISFRLQPTTSQRSHFLAVPFTEDSGATDWGSLRWSGVRNLGARAQASAEVILDDGDALPLLVVDQFRRGRTAAWLSDCAWSWWLEDDDTRRVYRQFWSRMVYWLAAREDGLSARLAIATARTRYPAGTEITVSGDLLDARNLPVRDASPELVFEAIDGGRRQLLLMHPEAERYRLDLPADRPGSYRLQARVTLDGEQLQSNELRLTVFASRVEDRQILADPGTLRDLAARTGGEYLALEQLGDLLARLNREAETITVRRTISSHSLWDTWLLLGIGLSALSLEWIARRRLGLP